MELTKTHESLRRGKTGLTAFIDRWIYVGMAAMLIVIVLIGFVPDSFEKLADVSSGKRPPLPLALHVHAVLMGAWLLLVLTQTALMATGRSQWHMQLGLIGLVLAPAMVAAGFVLVPVNVASKLEFSLAASPEVRASLERSVRTSFNISLGQIRVGACFAVLVGLAIAMRKRDPDLHKRLMILATITPMGAAFSRIPGLPSTMPESPLSQMLWPLAAAIPMFAWDLYRLRAVHRAYWWFAAVMLPTGVIVALLWDTPVWLDLAARLIIAVP